MVVLFALIATISAELDLSVKLPLHEAEKLNGQDLVEYLRRHQNLFRVKESEEAEERMKYLMDPKYLISPDDKDRKQDDDDEEPPEEFDARTAWPECADIINTVRDQTKCGSCWAVSAASVMTDRLCVQSLQAGKIMKRFLSDTDILSCCGRFCGYGCRGGANIRAWKHVMRNGVCTGGPYGYKV
ncbi:hypothetical protein Aduo_003633 [Ancylostoma duodenale]